MKLLVFALLSAAAFVPPPLLAWSEAAHRAIARVAQERLNDNATRRHRYMMGVGAKLEDVAMWADTVVEERPETEAWHSITIPPNATALDLQRDCPVGDCLPTQIRENEGIVRLAFKDKAQLIEAFQFVVHLVGDLHQPLHVGYPPGSLGDETPVSLKERGEAAIELTIHEVWERVLFDGLDVDALAARIRSRITPEKELEWTRGTLLDWTWDTHLTAVRVAYGALPSGSPRRLDEDYLSKARSAAEEQLAKAAVRLAAIINRIWPE